MPGVPNLQVVLLSPMDPRTLDLRRPQWTGRVNHLTLMLQNPNFLLGLLLGLLVLSLLVRLQLWLQL